MAKIQSCRNKCGTFIYVALHEGKWKPFDSQTNQLHDCPNSEYNKQNGQQPKQQIPVSTKSPAFDHVQPAEPQPSEDIRIANLITKVDNINIALTQIMSNISNIIENAGTFKEMQELKTENQQLKEVIKKQNLSFKPANEIPLSEQEESQTEHDQHVRDMVEKGKQASEEEELDLT